jgi:type II secretory pathway component PulC
MRLCSMIWLLALCAPPARAQEALPAEEAAGRPMPELKLNARSLASLDAALDSEPTPTPIEAGVIPKQALQAELQRGIGAFLRHVRTKPTIQRGRFVGWRVVELFKKRPEVRVLGLRPGDTVLKINGRSLERPEQLKLVWDALQDARELVIEIERAGRRCELRYVIA